MTPPEFFAAEYTQITESYDDNRRILIQVVVFLAIANVTVIGYAVTEKSYVLFLFGGLFMYIAYKTCVRSAWIDLTILLRGLKLEHEMGVTGLMHYTASSVRGNPNFLKRIEESGFFEAKDNQLEIAQQLVRDFGNVSMRYDVPFSLSRPIHYLIVFMALVQTIFGLVFIFPGLFGI